MVKSGEAMKAPISANSTVLYSSLDVNFFAKTRLDPHAIFICTLSKSAKSCAHEEKSAQTGEFFESAIALKRGRARIFLQCVAYGSV
jgi:hypothetical protein